MLPGQRQAIIETNAGILLIGSLGTNFSEIFIEIYTFSFKKMHLKMLYGKMAAILSRSQCVNTFVVTVFTDHTYSDIGHTQPSSQIRPHFWYGA